MFDKSDQKEAQQEAEDRADEKEVANNFQKEFNEFRRKLRAAALKGKKKVRNPLAKMRYPTKTPPGDYDPKEAQALCPPDAVIHHDTWNGRWELVYKKSVRISRSWGLYGHRESALMVIRLAWKRYMDDNLLEVCPIEDLLT